LHPEEQDRFQSSERLIRPVSMIPQLTMLADHRSSTTVGRHCCHSGYGFAITELKSGFSHHMSDGADDKQNNEYDEHDLGDPNRSARNSSETENSGDQRDNQECDG